MTQTLPLGPTSHNYCIGDYVSNMYCWGQGAQSNHSKEIILVGPYNRKAEFRVRDRDVMTEAEM
jgi:hypothetical protein